MLCAFGFYFSDLRYIPRTDSCNTIRNFHEVLMNCNWLFLKLQNWFCNTVTSGRIDLPVHSRQQSSSASHEVLLTYCTYNNNEGPTRDEISPHDPPQPHRHHQQSADHGHHLRQASTGNSQLRIHHDPPHSCEISPTQRGTEN